VPLSREDRAPGRSYRDLPGKTFEAATGTAKMGN